MNYFVYVAGLVGLETNTDGFKWSLGSKAPHIDKQVFDSCRIRVHIEVVGDKEVFADGQPVCGESFGHFSLKRNGMCLSYCRRFMKFIPLNYYISVKGNDIYARVGSSYLKHIKIKMMNIHPIGYILFDIVTALLLKEGFMPLYCSSFVSDSVGCAIMAPPNAGKTLTVMKLTRDTDAAMLGEDIAVTDGENIYSVPYTDTYRDYGSEQVDKAGLCRADADQAPLKKIFLLEKGERGSFEDPSSAQKVALLNRHGIGYHYSPALIALSYFNDSFSLDDIIARERFILDKLSNGIQTVTVTCEQPADYAGVIAGLIQ